jgi:hypothetical protein
VLILLSVSVTASFAQFSAGADIVSRYLWRGWDFGNSAAVQPALAYTTAAGEGSFEIGAWGSFALTGGGLFGDDSFNENDLYVSYSNGPVSVVLTDYFFPAYEGNDDWYDFSGEGAHIVEIGGSVGNDIVAGSVYYAFLTPDAIEKSFYFQVDITPPYEFEDVGVGLFIGGGNGFYDFVPGSENTKFVLSNFGITVSRGMFATTWAMNPDQKTTFLVFAASL